MLWLNEHTNRVQALVDEATPESLTFAALQCRLAIELVCYARLRNAHDYISPDDLKRWQPRDVVNTLIQEVDPHIASNVTISMAKQPGKGVSAAKQDFVLLGRQSGFDAKRLGRIWNGLGNFLHVRMPKARDDDVQFFGKPEDIEKKVLEALAMLREIEKGTLISSGFGEIVSFDCNCGSKNKRRTGQLVSGQIVSCINPSCPERWAVELADEQIGFRRQSIGITCHECGRETKIAEKEASELGRDEMLRVTCDCGASSYLMWKLHHAKREECEAGDSPVPSA